ncbi:wiskott-Aldrich syndrome protein homolog 1-like isoform X3 [Meles meles]|uniref:wiskott-Aldrich syndrome protein homolog 1-like isoform X3 n=1 Tax=Meles meles TaxID=9662 RepID=UPI001E69B215|nr:wiskott-Aldrich syndrome protein homolog 1-like isoform X3 [Meles meles]
MSRGGCRTHLPPRGPSRGLSCAGLFRWAWVGIRPPLLASQPAWLRSRAGEGHRCPLKSQAEPRWDQPRGQPALTSDPPGSTAANAGAPEKLLEAPPRLTPQADSGAPFAPTDPSAGRGHLGARDTALRGATLRPVAAPRCSSLGKGRPQPPPPAPPAARTSSRVPAAPAAPQPPPPRSRAPRLPVACGRPRRPRAAASGPSAPWPAAATVHHRGRPRSPRIASFPQTWTTAADKPEGASPSRARPAPPGPAARVGPSGSTGPPPFPLRRGPSPVAAPSGRPERRSRDRQARGRFRASL